MSYRGCGGYTGLSLNGSHPTLEDGEVTREVVGSRSGWWWGYSNQCGAYTSTSVQVKACPGDYYIYEFVKPIISAPRPTYCAGDILTLFSLLLFLLRFIVLLMFLNVTIKSKFSEY